MSSQIQPWAGIPASGPLLRPTEAARYIGFSRATYYVLAKQGIVPPPIHIGVGDRSGAGVPKPWLDAVIAAAAQ